MTGANGRCPLPTASPLPQIAALIEEHQLLKRIYRQRSTEEETAVIEEAIAAVDVFADIPVLMAKALADGISGEFAYQIGLAGIIWHARRENHRYGHLDAAARTATFHAGRCCRDRCGDQAGIDPLHGMGTSGVAGRPCRCLAQLGPGHGGWH
jgi:hypothetical protein